MHVLLFRIGSLLPLLLLQTVFEICAQPRWHNIPAFDAQDIAADPERPGTLWIAGIGGLYGYEAVKSAWSAYNTADGLPLAWGRAVFADSNAVWIGLERGGAGRFDRETRRFMPFLQPEDGESPLTVYVIRVDSTALWVGTDRGLLKVDPKSLEVVATLNEAVGLGANYVLDLVDDGDYLWAATAYGGPVIGAPPVVGGLARIEKAAGAVQNFRPFGSGSASHFVTLGDAGEDLWVGGNNGLFVFDKSSLSFSEVAPGLLGTVTAVLPTEETVWSTAVREYQEHIYRINPGTFEVESEAILPGHFRPASLDRLGEELYVVKGSHFLRISPDGSILETLSTPFLPAPHCDGIAAAADSVYVGSANHLVVLDSGTFRPIRSTAVFEDASISIRAIAVDGPTLWLGTDDGLLRYRRSSLSLEQAFLRGSRISDVLLSDRHVWTLPGPGLHLLERATGDVISISLRNAIGSDEEPLIEAVLLENQHAWLSIWATRNGTDVYAIVRLDVQTFEVLSKRELATGPYTSFVDRGTSLLAGGPDILEISKSDLEVARFIDQEARKMVLHDGHVWIAYGDVLRGGVKTFDATTGNELIEIGTADGLLHDYVTDIHLSEFDAWFTTYAGVSALDLASISLSSERMDEPLSNLLEIFPNPFRHPPTLRLLIERAQSVSLEVYDALGRRIAVLHDGFLTGGEHAFLADLSIFPAGIYFIRLRTENGNDMRSAVRIR